MKYLFKHQKSPDMGPNGKIYKIPPGTSTITTVLYMNKALVGSIGQSTPKTYADMVMMVTGAKSLPLGVFSFTRQVSTQYGWQITVLMFAVFPAMVIYLLFAKPVPQGESRGRLKDTSIKG